MNFPVWLAIAVSFVAQLCTSHGDFVLTDGTLIVHCKTKLWLCGDDDCSNRFSECDDSQLHKIPVNSQGAWLEVTE